MRWVRGCLYQVCRTIYAVYLWLYRHLMLGQSVPSVALWVFPLDPDVGAVGSALATLMRSWGWRVNHIQPEHIAHVMRASDCLQYLCRDIDGRMADVAIVGHCERSMSPSGHVHLELRLACYQPGWRQIMLRHWQPLKIGAAAGSAELLAHRGMARVLPACTYALRKSLIRRVKTHRMTNVAARV